MVRLTKIYTKTGDAGQSSLCTGERKNKDHLYFQAIGDVDELNAHIGAVDALMTESEIQEKLHRIQNELFDMGADLGTPLSAQKAIRMAPNQYQFLEQWIDAMNTKLPPLTSFVMPRGSLLVSHIHVARTVCRRAERSIVALHQQEGVNPDLMIYINRLSDMFFVLARFMTHFEEVLWKPKQSITE